MLLLLSGVEMNPGPAASAASRSQYVSAKLSLGSLNICSAVNKAGCIHDIITDPTFDLDLFALCETRIRHDDPPAVKNCIAPIGFSALHVHREPTAAHPAGGGLAIIHRNTLVVRPQRPLSTTTYLTFEYQLVRVTSTRPALTIVNLYRPPSTSVSLFFDELTDFLSSVGSMFDNLIICGDLNCPGPDPMSVDPDLAAVFDSFDLTQHVRTPTRNENLLDILAAEPAVNVHDVRVDDAGLLSDHRLVVGTVSAVTPQHRPIRTEFRPIKKMDVAQFEQLLRESSLFTSPASTVDEFTEQIESDVVAALDKVAPLRSRCRRPPKPITRWLSQEAVDAKRQRRRFERKWKRSGSDSDRLNYRRLCRQANILINDSRHRYYSNMLASATDCVGRWRVVKSLLHSDRSPPCRSDCENVSLCHTFSNFFTDKITSLKRAVAAETASLSSPCPSDNHHTGESFTDLITVTPDEVKKVLISIPAKSSSLDFVPTSLIKQCDSVFAEIITRLANLSFTQGKFPSKYKFSVVTPLLKKANLNSDDPANFRPISNLNNISKILERLFLNRFQTHVCNCDNFSPVQSAYRRNFSTETALLHTLDTVYTSANYGKPTLLISLDFSAAFDTIDHSTLLNRLSKSFGVTGCVLAWIESYLNDRYQCVRTGQAVSTRTLCHTGVPQGSVLGPLLFSCYISPISSLASSFGVSTQQYADDTQIYISLTASHLATELTMLSSCLSALHSWFCHNGLALNSSKSESILFGTRQRLHNFPPVTQPSIGGSTIPVSETIKTLGVTLDNQLTLKQHTQSVCRNIHFHTRALRHIRPALTESMAATIAASIVQSRLDYSNALLHGTLAGNIHKLQCAQNSLSRAVLPYHHGSASSRLSHLHWLPVHRRIEFKISVITYKSLTTHQPPYLSNLLHPYRPSRSLRSANQNLLLIPPHNTNFSRRAFSFSAPTIWNKLPFHIRESNTLITFKRRLKTYLTSLTTLPN